MFSLLKDIDIGFLKLICVHPFYIYHIIVKFEVFVTFLLSSHVNHESEKMSMTLLSRHLKVMG